MDTLRPALASLRAAPVADAHPHGARRPLVPHGELPCSKAALTRDLLHCPATALRLTLPTLLLARQAFDQDRRNAAACVRTAELLLAQHRPTEALDCLDQLDTSMARGAAWHLMRASTLSTL
ncbi:hypothetical protein, partial [Sphaerotilus sp.]|uniref:hypothetical protein n=1 Tax=Sphaerotilus sp. TaxID=2093942 RepID=UPI0034E2C14A